MKPTTTSVLASLSLLALAALVPAAPVHHNGAVIKRWWGQNLGYDAIASASADNGGDGGDGGWVDASASASDFDSMTVSITAGSEPSSSAAIPAPALPSAGDLVAAPAPSASASASASVNATAGASGHPTPVGETYSGIATFYDVSNPSDNGGAAAGSVACSGHLYSDGDNIVAVNIPQFAGSCGRTVFLIDTETGNTATATAVDECASCPSAGDLDLVTDLWSKLHNGNTNAGVFKLQWYFTS